MSSTATQPEPAVDAPRRIGDELFGIDARSLAALRIGLGVTLLFDLYVRAHSLKAHYTDAGIMPREALDSAYGWMAPYVSLHYHTGAAAWMQTGMFILAAVCAVLLVLGWHTRLVTVISWLLLLSLHRRFSSLLNAGDFELRLLLFWAMFLPTGARWSLDSLRQRGRGEPGATRYRNGATIAIMLQVCFIYWFTVLLKTGSEWWNGQAAGLALELDLYATPAGVWLRQYAALMPLLTWATMIVEILGPTIVWIPFAVARWRMLAIVMMWGLHASFIVCMDIGLFGYVSMLGWVVFLPTSFWTFWRRGEAAPVTQRAPLWSLREGALLALLVFVFMWNVSTLDHPWARRAMPRALTPVGKALGLAQQWSMFAPYPLRWDGWFVMPAELADGRTVDLWAGGAPVTWDKPLLVIDTFPTYRWRKFMVNLRRKYDPDKPPSPEWPYMLHYLCREWNATHSRAEQVYLVEVYFVDEFYDGFRLRHLPRKVTTHRCVAPPD